MIRPRFAAGPFSTLLLAEPPPTAEAVEFNRGLRIGFSLSRLFAGLRGWLLAPSWARFCASLFLLVIAFMASPGSLRGVGLTGGPGQAIFPFCWRNTALCDGTRARDAPTRQGVVTTRIAGCRERGSRARGNR
jgi:hypothetical protein